MAFQNSAAAKLAAQEWVRDSVAAQTSYGPISEWDMSKVTGIDKLFEHAGQFNDDIAAWDVSNVTTMADVFKNAVAFNGSLAAWDTSKVENVRAMFDKSAFNGDISAWDMSNVETMGIFCCAGSTTSRINGNVFNGDIAAWDTSKVTSFDSIFHGALFNGDITAWDTSKATSMTKMFVLSLFNGSLTTWDTSKASDKSHMFEKSAFNGDINAWDMSSTTKLRSMFDTAAAFNSNLSAWDVSNKALAKPHNSFFKQASAFNGDIAAWDFSSFEAVNGFFEGASAFNGDISAWDTSKVKTMETMFKEAPAFNVDLSSWDLSAVTNMKQAFSGASSLSNCSKSLLKSSWSNQDMPSDVWVYNFETSSGAYGTALNQSGIDWDALVPGIDYCTGAPSASTDTSASATGDLHIHHAGGGWLDVRGGDGMIYNLLQAKAACLNGLFTFANFTLSPDDPRIAEVLEVHGSHLTAVFLMFATVMGGKEIRVRITYSAAHPSKVYVSVVENTAGMVLVDMWLGKEDFEGGEFIAGGVKVMQRAAAPIMITVSDGDWKFSLTPGTYRSNGARRTRIDVAIAALKDPLTMPVAAHGLIGQGFDGLPINGKVDSYQPDNEGVFTTTAQGEGAIEGVVQDYVVKPQSNPFSTNFEFSRFDKESAPPRDVSKLNAVTTSA